MFGLIDIYQFFASFADWFPKEHFKWHTTDDLLHIIIGGLLIIVGIFSKSSRNN